MTTEYILYPGYFVIKLFQFLFFNTSNFYRVQYTLEKCFSPTHLHFYIFRIFLFLISTNKRPEEKAITAPRDLFFLNTKSKNAKQICRKNSISHNHFFLLGASRLSLSLLPYTENTHCSSVIKFYLSLKLFLFVSNIKVDVVINLKRSLAYYDKNLEN